MATFQFIVYMLKYSKDGVSVLVIIDRRRAKKNGLFPVKAEIVHRRTQKYFTTGVDMSPEEWEKWNGSRRSSGKGRRIESMKKAAEQVTVLQSDLDKLQKEYDKLVHEQTELEKQLQQEQTAHEKVLEQQREQSQIALDKAVLEVERKYQEQLQELKEKHQAEIDKYQQKYLTLLEQLSNVINLKH